MNIKEDLINIEVMGGWPIFKMNLKEILKSLGAIEKDGFIGFNNSDSILKLYPKRLIDDGMGYGVDEQYIICADTDNNSYINIFTETTLPETELNELKEEYFHDNR